MTKFTKRPGPPRLTPTMAAMLRLLIAGVGPTWAPSYRQTLTALQRLQLAHKPRTVAGLVWCATQLGVEALAAYDAQSPATG